MASHQHPKLEEEFAPNAYDSEPSSDDKNDPIMENVEYHPVPKAWHYGLYRLATPSMKRVFEDPDNAEATKVLSAINTVIMIDNKLLGLPRTRHNDYTILYHAIAGQARAMKRISLEHEPSPENAVQTEQAVHACNTAIAEIVRRRHYLQCWKATFSLNQQGGKVQVVFPTDNEDGLSLGVQSGRQLAALPVDKPWRPSRLQRSQKVCWRQESPIIEREADRAPGHMSSYPANIRGKGGYVHRSQPGRYPNRRQYWDKEESMPRTTDHSTFAELGRRMDRVFDRMDRLVEVSEANTVAELDNGLSK